MKALTVRQPWASLIALGIKTIETRSWRTDHRGPIIVHAGAAKPTFRDGSLGVVGRFVCERRADLGGAYTLDDGAHDEILPLGAVVAIANLVDCVPIEECSEDRRHVCTFLGDALLHEPLHEPLSWDSTYPPVSELVIGNQAPYGDFTPGRWAWLLDDVQPLAVPIPAKGRLGLWDWKDDQ